MFRITRLDWTQHFYSAKTTLNAATKKPEVVQNRASSQKGPASLPQKDLEEELVKSALERMLRNIEIFNKRFKFKICRKTGEIVVQVVDARTHKVIKEIPPKEIVELHARLRELASEVGQGRTKTSKARG